MKTYEARFITTDSKIRKASWFHRKWNESMYRVIVRMLNEVKEVEKNDKDKKEWCLDSIKRID